jgi:catechol 2,3-dioxygenase-like lactoylglutathione lyase family enzyme
MSAPALTRIGQIAIAVHDLDRAIDFYRDVLGLRFLFRAPPGLGFFDVGGVRLMLGLPEGGTRDHHTSVLYYEVPDIAASAAALKERKVVFEREPHLVARLGETELWIGFFRDSEGNLVGIMQEK